MTNTHPSADDSGLNLDHLEALRECERFLEDMHCMPIEWTIAQSQVMHQKVRAALANQPAPLTASTSAIIRNSKLRAALGRIIERPAQAVELAQEALANQPAPTVPARHPSVVSEQIDENQERAKWTTKQWYEHVGAWETSEGHIAFGSVMALRAMLIQFQRAYQHAPAVQAATPNSDFKNLTRYSQWSNGSACGMDPSPEGRWVEYDDIIAHQPAQEQVGAVFVTRESALDAIRHVAESSVPGKTIRAAHMLMSAPVAQQEPVAAPDRITEHKREHLEQRGYRVVGYVMQDETHERCTVAHGKLDWQPAAAPQQEKAPGEQLWLATLRACRELPEGYEVRIELENGCGMAVWYDAEGERHVIDGEGYLSDDVSEAIDLAIQRAAAPKGGA